MHLYVFTGFPRCGLHAGGLRRMIQLEEIGVLEEVLAFEKRDSTCFVSPACIRDGVTFGWFPPGFNFGNGVSILKTIADPRRGARMLQDGRLLTAEGWAAYEARWLPGTCPREPHNYHATICLFQSPLAPSAWARLQEVIEGGAEPDDPDSYENESEPGLYKSTARPLTFGGRTDRYQDSYAR